MNRVFLILAIALNCQWHAPSVKAESYDCVPDKGCAKGEWPKCCQPPPCEFWQAIIAASGRVIAMGRVLFEDPDFADDDQEGNLALLNLFVERVDAEIRKWEAKTSELKCGKPSQSPTFSVDPAKECRIEARIGADSFGESSLAQAQQYSNTCEEVVRARYATANARSEGGTCWLEQHFPERYGDRMVEFANETFREYKELHAELLKYWRACSNVFDAKVARKVARDGLLALQGAERLAKPRKPAKRTGKSKKRR